jgi:hypothetical protein
MTEQCTHRRRAFWHAQRQAWRGLQSSVHDQSPVTASHIHDEGRHEVSALGAHSSPAPQSASSAQPSKLGSAPAQAGSQLRGVLQFTVQSHAPVLASHSQLVGPQNSLPAVHIPLTPHAAPSSSQLSSGKSVAWLGSSPSQAGSSQAVPQGAQTSRQLHCPVLSSQLQSVTVHEVGCCLQTPWRPQGWPSSHS